jgi:hypothetical protein
VAILPLAAGIGTGDLTNATDLAPTYRNSLMICAALMAAGAATAAVLIPTKLKPATPVPVAAPATATPYADAETAPASPIRTYCDVAAPPVHPRNDPRAPAES